MAATLTGSSLDWELGSAGGPNPELQAMGGLCSCSLWLRTFSLDIWEDFTLRAGVKCEQAAVSIPGWTKPWLPKFQAEECHTFPGAGRGESVGPVPGIQWGQLQHSVHPQSQRRHQDPSVVTDLEVASSAS